MSLETSVTLLAATSIGIVSNSVLARILPDRDVQGSPLWSWYGEFCFVFLFCSHTIVTIMFVFTVVTVFTLNAFPLWCFTGGLVSFVKWYCFPPYFSLPGQIKSLPGIGLLVRGTTTLATFMKSASCLLCGPISQRIFSSWIVFCSHCIT